MAAEQWRIRVSGRVQGVFYRGSTQQTAQSLGLTGWVRNLQDGRVEILAEGDLDQLQQLLDWCWHGPAAAEVSNVEHRVEAATGRFNRFEVAATC